MDRYESLNGWWLSLAVLASGCGSGPHGERAPADRADEPVASAWFGVRGAKCEVVVPALGVATTMRAGTVSPWRVADEGPWCAVAPTQGGVGLRIDSMAQHVSEALKLPVLAFYVARGAWSYTVFDRGEPVLSLESHVGEPLLSGDSARAGGLLEMDAQALEDTADEGRKLAALSAFVDATGLKEPATRAKVVDAQRPGGPGPVVGPDGNGDTKPELTLARIPPGAWAAIPPLGVVLVKAVEMRTKDGVQVPTYVLVDDMTTLDVPVARAEAMGMRPIASAAEVQATLKLVDDGVDAGDKDYDPKRVKAWLDAMGGGELVKIARVYATLCALKSERTLFQIEDGLLSTSREWLAEEIATARGSQSDAIDELLRGLCK